eukprot:6472890-Amphidinium_carterae.1
MMLTSCLIAVLNVRGKSSAAAPDTPDSHHVLTWSRERKRGTFNNIMAREPGTLYWPTTCQSPQLFLFLNVAHAVHTNETMCLTGKRSHSGT